MARQRRHNRTRRTRGRFRALHQLLAVILALTALFAGCIVFFRVQTTEVAGNRRYTAEEIISVSGVENGDYLALLDKNYIVRKIRAELPYVESVSIKRSLPDSVLITVTESTAAAAVEADGSWWLINSSGKLLEEVSSPGSHAVLLGITPLSPQVGSMAQLTGETTIRWEYAMGFLRTLQDMGLSEALVSLDCSSAGEFTARYGERFSLLIPSTGDFEEYLTLFARAVEEELDEAETGIFDFTHYDSTGYVYFRHEN